MSEQRDLQRERDGITTVLEMWSGVVAPTRIETLALHAIDRAIAAEKELQHQTKELNRLRMLEKGLSDFQNDMLSNSTAADVYEFIKSTVGYKNIYPGESNEKNGR